MPVNIVTGRYLEYFLSLIVKLNDVALVANPWIISSSMSPELKPLLPSPFLLAALYGVLEPIYTKTLIWLPVPIGFYLTSTLMSHMYFVAYTASIIDSRPGHDPNQRNGDLIQRPGDHQQEQSQPNNNTPRKVSSPGAVFRSLFLPLQSAALSNASQLVLYNRLPIKPWINGPSESAFFNLWGEFMPTLVYIWMRKWDLGLTIKTSRALYIGRHPDLVYEQIACLLILIGVRTATRALIGIDIWMAFRQPSRTWAEKTYSLTAYMDFGYFIVRVVAWWQWLGLPSYSTVKILYGLFVASMAVWWMVTTFKARRRRTQGQ